MNSVACLLERAAARWPENIALEDAQGTLTYGELRARALAAAAALRGFGLGPGRPAAVLLPRSGACVVCFYAALYCGAPYAPLDYGAPAERVRRTLESLRPAVVITDAAGREKLSDFTGCAVVDHTALPETAAGDFCPSAAALDAVVDSDPAYIMYTSGSTGTPKGVAIPHRNIIDYAHWAADTFHITGETVFGLQSGFHFDNSVFDLYSSALTGAKVLIIPEALFMYPVKLMEFVREKRVTCILWVPTVMISVANSGALDGLELPDLQTVTFAGEVMPSKQLNVWRRALPGRVYANLYGPTETDVCTCYVVDRDFADQEALPIGYARANMRVVILKEDGSEAAPGEQGELCVVGSGVALGYWNNPEETARAFAPNPLTGPWPEPMYRTGDLAYKDAGGLIWYVGRRDSQIKLRGNRIELGDVENAARAVPGVARACAVFDAASERIVLFAETSEPLTLRKFNLALGELLPKYMLPGKLVCMERLPLNANRKIDRAALKASLAEEG